MKKTFKKRTASLLMSVVLMVAMAGSFEVMAPTSYAASKSELEAQLQQLQQKEKEIKGELSAASSDLSASKKRKELLDAQIDNARQQIALLDKQLAALESSIDQKSGEISSTNDKIAKKEKEIQQKEAEIDKKLDEISTTHEKLGQRLREIAKTGNGSTMQRLLDSENYVDFLLKEKAAERFAKRDQALMDELEKALTKINKEKDALQKEKKDLQGQRTNLENQKKAKEAEQKEVERLKGNSNAKKKELDTLYAAVQTEIRKLQNEVSSYNEELRETQKKIEEADAAIEALVKNTASTGTYDQALMTWPVPTVRNISSHYGPRWGTMHRGLDISNGPIPIYGENIVAAADGVVIAVNSTSWYGSGWSYGYGYCVIIDHGRDSQGRTIHTMYAHCSAMYASMGQKVTAGQVIAKAGNSGDVTGPHLHFEVRVNGDRVNPYPNYVQPNKN